MRSLPEKRSKRLCRLRDGYEEHDLGFSRFGELVVGEGTVQQRREDDVVLGEFSMDGNIVFTNSVGESMTGRQD